MSIVRLSKSVVGEEEKLALARVIDAGYLGMGIEVQLFEQELRAYLATSYEVVCVNTGTAALHLALQAIGVGPGDEVLVPSITYVATFQAISATGAKPIACEVTPDMVFIDLEDAKSRLTSRTKAIIPVHYGSNSVGIEEVYKFANKHNIRIIEDAAHSFGCSRGNAKIGSQGDIVCFSFDGIKNITSGEGGAIVTSDAEVARKVKDARLLGVEKDTEKRYAGSRSWSFDVHDQGWRYHMSNLMAAIGRAQLRKIEYFSECRRIIAQRYVSALESEPNISLLSLDYKSIVPHIFPIRIFHGKRSAVMDALRANGIESGIHYQPNHLLDHFSGRYPLPISELLGEELLSLPIHPEVTKEDQDRVVKIILAAVTKG